MGSPAARPRIESLNGCRFVAACLVVCYHYLPAVWRGPLPARALIARGFMAVDFFFVLSGFILAYNYAELTSDDPVGRWRFWAARFCRIYPTYLLALLLAAPISLNAMRQGLLKFSVGKWAIGGMLAMAGVQAWVPPAARSWNFPAWSISCELFFYAMFPYVISRFRRQRARGALLSFAALWLVSMAGPGGLLVLNHFGLRVHAQGWESPVDVGELFVLHFPLFHLPSFLMGTIAGVRFLQAGAFSRKGCAMCVAGGLIAVTLVALAPIPNEFLQDGLLAPAFALLISSLAGVRIGGDWVSRVGRILGDSSYAMYLFQVPVFCAVAAYFKILGFDDDHAPAVYFALSFGILIAGAILISRRADGMRLWLLAKFQARERSDGGKFRVDVFAARRHG